MNPPIGASPSDLLQNALSLFQDQKNSAFKSLPAWKKLKFAPKWRMEQTKVPNSVTVDLSGNKSNGNEDFTSDPPTPSPASSGFTVGPIGIKAAKKRRLTEGMEEDKSLLTSHFNDLSEKRVTAISDTNRLTKSRNKLTRENLLLKNDKIKIEEEII